MTAITERNVAEPRVLSCGSGSQGAYAWEQNNPPRVFDRVNSTHSLFFWTQVSSKNIGSGFVHVVNFNFYFFLQILPKEKKFF